MKKILIGTFLTAAIVIAGSTNAKAQSKSTTKVINRETVKTEKQNKKVVEAKKLNSNTKKVMPNKKATKTNTKVTKKIAKEKMKRQPAKLNTKKN